MADKKISELTGAGALTGTEEVPIVQGGVTVKTTTQDIADLGGGGGAVDSVNGQTGVVVLDATDVGAEPTLGFTPENVANKSGSLSASATLYPNNDAVIAGLATKKNLLDTRVVASITGTYDLDWSAGDVFVLTVTGAVIISDINLPTGTNAKVIELIVNGNFAVTLPLYWEALPSNDTYSGTVRNHFVVSCINGTTSSEDVIYSLENLA